MSKLSKVKFNELRDTVAEILKEAVIDEFDAPKICISALNRIGNKETVYAIRAIPQFLLKRFMEISNNIKRFFLSIKMKTQEERNVFDGLKTKIFSKPGSK